MARQMNHDGDTLELRNAQPQGQSDRQTAHHAQLPLVMTGPGGDYVRTTDARQVRTHEDLIPRGAAMLATTITGIVAGAGGIIVGLAIAASAW